MEEEEETVIDLNFPAKNIPELSIATLNILNDLKELTMEEENEMLLKYLDIYSEKNPLHPINFDDISLEWFNVSEPLDIQDHLNSYVVVLDFFTYCCINCMHILPDLEALENKYIPNESPVLVVGIHSGKFDNERLTKSVSDAVKKYNISHPVANDLNCKLWDKHGISCWPTLVILGPGGIPLFVLVGEGHKEILFKLVDESVKYFDKLGRLNHKLLPLMPNLYIPSEKSNLYYPGKIGIYPGGLIISDSGNNRIVLTKINGEIEVVVGSGKRGFQDGTLEGSSFNNPQGVVYHPSGCVYVADTDNHAIRKINLKDGYVETITGTGIQGLDKEGGLLWQKQVLSSPWDLALAHSHDRFLTGDSPNLLLIAMAGSHQIWGVFLREGSWLKNSHYPEGTVIQLAGSGIEENRNTSYPLKAGFAQPSGITISTYSGSQIAYIADSESSSIRLFSLVDGSVKRVAGGGLNPTDLFAYGDKDGAGNVARFQHPLGVVSYEDKLYVADSYNHAIKMIEKQNKNYIVKKIFGNKQPDGDKSSFLYFETLNEPGGLCIREDGKCIYVADTNNCCIKECNLESHAVTKININFNRANNTFEGTEDAVDSSTFLNVEVPADKVDILLKLKLVIPAEAHLTPESHQKFYISSKDSLLLSSVEGTLSDETEVPITIDLSSSNEHKLLIRCRLLLCLNEGGVCLMREVTKIVQFVVESGNVYADPISINVQIKPTL